MRFLWSQAEDRNLEMAKLLAKFSANPALTNSQLKQDVADVIEYVLPSPQPPPFWLRSELETSEGVIESTLQVIVQLDDKTLFRRALPLALSLSQYFDKVHTMLKRHGFPWLEDRLVDVQNPSSVIDDLILSRFNYVLMTITEFSRKCEVIRLISEYTEKSSSWAGREYRNALGSSKFRSRRDGAYLAAFAMKWFEQPELKIV